LALDEATTGFLAQLAASDPKSLTEMTPPEARGFYAELGALSGPGPEMASVRDEELAAADGSPFRLRVLVPPGEIGGLVVFYHGGGWVIGGIDENDALCRTLAVKLGAAVVNVDYRLAPEHPYPAGPEDCWAALRWAAQRMPEIAGHDVPLIVMGDSAGGNLSAVIAQRALQAGGPRIDCQVLVYPVTDSDFETDGYRDPANQLMLSTDAMRWFWDHYVPDPADRQDPDIAPIRAGRLAGLPPAVVLTAEYDVLRDEGEAYAARLRDAGVPVELRRFAGQMHGFFTMLNILPGSAQAIDYIAEQLGPLLAAGSRQEAPA
jgi:acetyl esterase